MGAPLSILAQTQSDPVYGSLGASIYNHIPKIKPDPIWPTSEYYGPDPDI